LGVGGPAVPAVPRGGQGATADFVGQVRLHLAVRCQGDVVERRLEALRAAVRDKAGERPGLLLAASLWLKLASLSWAMCSPGSLALTTSPSVPQTSVSTFPSACRSSIVSPGSACIFIKASPCTPT